MSADILRRAAVLMRERAEAARAGRWVADGQIVTANWEHEPRAVVYCDGSPIREGNVANAAHIAGMDPAVARAVADWLEATAITDANAPYALTAASAYLGEQP